MESAFDGDPDWQITHQLVDGTTMRVRPILPEDRDELRHAFEEASPQTRYLRFGLAVGTLTDAALTYLTCVDQRDHVALVGISTSPDLKAERGVGVARFVRSKNDPQVAEAAVAVIDDMQHKGVGRALTRELARAALARGITKLRADVLRVNGPMRTILERVGARPLAPEDTDATTTYELDLTPFAE